VFASGIAGISFHTEFGHDLFIRTLNNLTADPSSQIRKLKGTIPSQPIFTFRIGPLYRAILSIHDDVLLVHILEIEGRKNAYRDF
jgi:mRNA interferase RelE/StbE